MTYQSAHDLPSFVEMSQQLNTIKLMRFALPRDQRPQYLELQRQLKFIGDTVDEFYSRLGERHWIYHDSLSVPEMAKLLAEASNAADAEAALIAHYQDQARFDTTLFPGIKLFPELRKRRALLELARDDYFSGRYYSCTLVLLTVMDGFVNEFETVRRGLHARLPEELDVADSVIAHHLGLSNAHKTFTKSKGATSEDPIVELYRHGIIHGTLLNYNNDIVATKAWNRLFAIVDWAKARRKEQEPPTAQPSWRAIFAQLLADARQRTATEAWKPSELTPGDNDFATDSAITTCTEYLELWERRNYGAMSKFIAHTLREAYGNELPLQIRNAYEPHRLLAYEITKIRHIAAAVCEIEARLTLEARDRTATFRWLHEDDNGQPVPDSLTGAWHMVLWGPDAFLND